MQTYQLYSINGPVVTVRGRRTALSMREMVYVGRERLVGAGIRLDDTWATIQVYEETSGLKAGEPVEPTGGPLSVTLGPGILRNIYDGIQRPLPAIEEEMGSFIQRGARPRAERRAGRRFALYARFCDQAGDIAQDGFAVLFREGVNGGEG